MKTKLFIAALVCGILAAPSLQAKDASDLRIYINPGHGSWTGGDRNMGTIKHGEPKNINDTLGFFESNTNLWKCLGIVDRLAEYGLKFDRTLNQDNPTRWLVGAARDLRNNIFMSRVKNGPGPDETGEDLDDVYNRSLYEICCEVERNNFDMFFSLHSNAAGSDLVNYPAIFLRGENKVAGVEGSDTNARKAWPFAWAQEHQFWTHYSATNPNVIYDVDFWGGDYAINNIDGKTYKGYYGVLRHGVMGYMAEGYFHTYGPGRHRAMNPDVCRDEGDAYARGIAEIFGLQREDNGTLYGIVRDQHESFRHKFYNATVRSNDNFLPLNNVKVDLVQNGQTIATYTTDDEWNGAFVFSHLQPGTYFVNASVEGYKKADTFGPFEVKAGETTYPCIWLENESYEAPAANPDLYVDPVTSPVIGAADTYVMSKAAAADIDQLQGKTIRRVIARGEHVYVLALDADQKPTLLVLDTDLNVVSQLGTAACKGSYRDLADVQFTADGILVGSSASVTHFSDATIDSDFGDTKRGSVNFYRWDNNAEGIPSGEARLWFTTLASGNLYRGLTANSFSYTGTSDNGQFFFPTASSYGVERMFFNYVEVIDGEVQAFSMNNSGKNTDYFAQSVLGLNYTFTPSPLDDEIVIVNAPGCPARSFNIFTLEAAGNISSDVLANEHHSTSFFKYAGHSYMAYPGAEGPALIDITDGVENAKAVEVIMNASRAEGDAATHAAGITKVTRDSQDKVTGADIDVFTAAGNTITRYTTTGNEQPAVAGVYAYGLAATPDDNGYTLSFSLTADADARIELLADGSEPIVAAQGSYQAGANTVTVSADDLAEGTTYAWQVVVANKAVPTIAEIYSNTTQKGSGVVQDQNPESEHFGDIYYSSWSDREVYSFTPAMEMSAPLVDFTWDTSVGSSPWRLALLPSSQLLISDWGDKHGGIYRLNPSSPDQLYSMFAGTIKPSSGEWIYDGKTIGGSTASVAVKGTGEDTKLYTFQEDYPSDYALSMVCYNLGTAEQITSIPEQTFPNASKKLINGNVMVLLADNFMVLGQVRGAGNNTAGVPSFIIVNYEDEILFNSSDLDLSGSCGGFLLTPDAKRLFVMDPTTLIHVYDIDMSKEEDQLTEAYTFQPSNVGTTYQMAFDYAGNLILPGRTSLKMYTLPCAAREVTTPAAATQALSKSSAVEGIAIGTADNAAAEYFNLQGIRVSADNITPGVYVRRQGNVATKVIVR